MKAALEVSRRGEITLPNTAEVPKPGEYFPASDAEAKELIDAIGTYRWDTHKVRGRFTHNPYGIRTRTERGEYMIYLPGRRGTVLTWLRDKLDAAEQKELR